MGHARWSLLAAALFSISVGLADHKAAGAQREAAMRIRSLTTGYPYRVWFQGHWGFQYYMESIGARPLDFHTGLLKTGDIIVIPMNGGNVRWAGNGPLVPVAAMQLAAHPWIATMHNTVGAGFYSDRWGVMPFVVGATPREEFRIVMAGEFDDPLSVASVFRDAVKRNPESPGRFQALTQTIQRVSSGIHSTFAVAGLYDIAPNPPSYYVHTGNLLRRSRRLFLAAANYEKALSLAPDDLEAMKGLGIVYGLQGKYEKAAKILCKAATTSAPEVTACYLAAAMYAKLNRPDEAARWLGQAKSRGMQIREPIAKDPNFNGIRNHPAFKHVLDSPGAQNKSTDSN
jgi:Flp pilus assembly protein TadD